MICVRGKDKPHDVTRSFKAISEKWLDSMQPKIKYSSMVKYQNVLKAHVWPLLGEIPINQLTSQKLESYCNYLLSNGGRKKVGLAPKTVSDTLSIVRSVLRFAREYEEVPDCTFTHIPIKQSYKEIRVFSRKEQKLLCDYLYAHLDLKNLGILICLFTGLRIGEICALCWENISLSEGVLYVSKTMQRIQSQSNSLQKTEIIITAPKSPHSIRQIPLPKELADIISKQYTGRTGFVLVDTDKVYVEPRSMQYRLKKVLKEVGISDANFHALRHTFATRCVELGFDMKTLSEILGHSSIHITMNRYVHPSMELKSSHMQRLSTLLNAI